ncbi:MAG: DUF3658 domain-containing protein [Gemmiger sp.]|nr:DUF3658 domain-containing protein [Gemmiger sp.]
MLEVCFSDSVKGALAVAQHGEDEMGGATSFTVITDKKGPFAALAKAFYKKKAMRDYNKRQAELQPQAVALGGEQKDLVGLSFGLSEGDIQAPICSQSCPRKACVAQAFSFDRYNDAAELQDAAEPFWQACIQDLEKLQAAPASVRIWLDATPDAQCGLLFVADLLQGTDTEMRLVELPQTVQQPDGLTVRYRGWGEVEPLLMGTFLDRERVLDAQERERLARRWQTLKAENAPLRVVENGEVISTELCYYDDAIRKAFPQDTCNIANIIGRALGNQEVPTGDVFVAKRLQAFIESGELAVTKNSTDGFYKTVVRVAK